ncbi:hypothetical protein BHYA_0193g00170 [Botrytis hyacinthi]|uniref:Uncharacterized protein n=1 Tax=Botrytis hyacinthi TaxID=278943 RepID=A0A4Z1GKY1_9HELO|nr:hypothetical protein BHYA_0193g00170 [Botrytis hyacinthi]
MQNGDMTANLGEGWIFEINDFHSYTSVTTSFTSQLLSSPKYRAESHISWVSQTARVSVFNVGYSNSKVQAEQADCLENKDSAITLIHPDTQYTNKKFVSMNMASHASNFQTQSLYLAKLSELVKEDLRYSALDYKIRSTESDSRDGRWAIINDTSSDAGVLSQSSSFTFDTEHSSVDKDIGTPKKAEEFLHAITRFWDGMTDWEVESAAKNPLELLVPVIKDIKDYFSRDMEYMNWSPQSWISDLEFNLSAVSRAQRDDALLKAWHNGRGSLKSFEKITSRIEDYQDQMIAQGVIEYGHNDNQKIRNMLRQHRKSLQEAYRLEQHVRDTLQMNVGNLSLKESRKSLEKANSLGRLSILAFVFLPFSLVTSFFGMNISEMTGNGALWKIFLIVAAI